VACGIIKRNVPKRISTIKLASTFCRGCNEIIIFFMFNMGNILNQYIVFVERKKILRRFFCFSYSKSGHRVIEGEDMDRQLS
jgi:hypothetical protein